MLVLVRIVALNISSMCTNLSVELAIVYIKYYITKDIDECEMEEEVCAEGCVNTEGGFFCTCYHHGYEVTDNQQSCDGRLIALVKCCSLFYCLELLEFYQSTLYTSI